MIFMICFRFVFIDFEWDIIRNVTKIGVDVSMVLVAESVKLIIMTIYDWYNKALFRLVTLSLLLLLLVLPSSTTAEAFSGLYSCNVKPRTSCNIFNIKYQNLFEESLYSNNTILWINKDSPEREDILFFSELLKYLNANL